MFRNLIGFAIFAVVAMLAFKLLFGLFGLAIGLLMGLVWLAFLGLVVLPADSGLEPHDRGPDPRGDLRQGGVNRG